MTATSDIVVRRCAVRVVRHGGWSWGPQPQRLVDQVLAALPGLIAERLGDLAPDGAADVEITEPVRIAVSLTLADLLAGRFDPLQHAAMAAEPLPEPLLLRVQPCHRPPSVRTGRRSWSGRRHPVPARQPMTLAEFLAGLFERGELGPVPGAAAGAHPGGLVPVAHRSPAEGARHPVRGSRPVRLPGGTGYLAADVPGQPPGVAASQETGRSRQLRDAISAIAARISRRKDLARARPTTWHPVATTAWLRPPRHQPDRSRTARRQPGRSRRVTARQSRPARRRPHGRAAPRAAAAAAPGTAATSSARSQPRAQPPWRRRSPLPAPPPQPEPLAPARPP